MDIGHTTSDTHTVTTDQHTESFQSELEDRGVYCELKCKLEFVHKNELENEIKKTGATMFERKKNPWIGFGSVMLVLVTIVIAGFALSNSYGCFTEKTTIRLQQDSVAIVGLREDIQYAKRNNVILEEQAVRDHFHCARYK